MGYLLKRNGHIDLQIIICMHRRNDPQQMRDQKRHALITARIVLGDVCV